jgi:hypothetical protein
MRLLASNTIDVIVVTLLPALAQNAASCTGSVKYFTFRATAILASYYLFFLNFFFNAEAQAGGQITL